MGQQTEYTDLPAAKPLIALLDELKSMLEKTQDNVVVYRSTVIHHAIARFARDVMIISEDEWDVIRSLYIKYRQDTGRMSFILRGGDFESLENVKAYIESNPDLWQRVRSNRRGHLGKRTLVTFAIIYQGIKSQCVN